MFKRNLLIIGILMASVASLYAQWSRNILPKGFAGRHANSVYIIDRQHAIVAGGHLVNDSIQYLSRTADGGRTWDLDRDAIASWLRWVQFVNDTTGFAVGYNGAILRTKDGGNTWSNVSAPGNTAYRHFNSVFFVSPTTGYIAGGNPSNDSIQTILKTTNGGDTWSIQRDNLGYWLKAVFFSDANTGYAVGESGVILKTTNGGLNWNALTLTGNMATRNFNAVYFLDNSTGFAVGGNKSNDSIQTILKTIDGGANWGIVRDIIAPMLNGIDFADTTKAYAVGDYGTILTSNDAGDNWQPVLLPDSINDTLYSFYAVSFIDTGFGMAVGEYGKAAIYGMPPVQPVSPNDSTLPATNIGIGVAQLNGLVDANNIATAVSFEYGTTSAFGNTIVAIPDTLTGDTMQSVTAQLTGLINSFYYYRVKTQSTSGTFYGNTVAFYAGDCGIPNCNFEIWDTTLLDRPRFWNSIGLTRKVLSYNGSTAIEVTGISTDKRGGAVVIGRPEGGISGGMPFAERPDSIIFHARYNTAPGDTARIALFFRKNGVFINQVLIPITGNSGSSFVKIHYPLHFPTNDVPDTLLAALFSTNIFGEQSPVSVLAVDDIRFTGTNLNLPNPDFELWDTATRSTPQSWTGNDDTYYSAAGTMGLIKKTSDVVSGQYAALMQNNVGLNRAPLFLNSGPWFNDRQPAFAVTGKHESLNLYLKYLPQSNDTLTVSVNMYKNGAMIGAAGLTFDTAIASYTPFSTTIYYQQPNIIPDSACINFTVGSFNAPGNTSVYIDNISFDGFRSPTNPVNIVEQTIKNLYCLIYPNPAGHEMNVEYYSEGKGREILEVYDYSGKKVHEQSSIGFNAGLVRQTINTSSLPQGYYVLSIVGRQGAGRYKFAVMH